MKKVLYTLAALSFVFAACNKQEIVPEEGTSQEGELTTVTIKASNGDADTKAAISDDETRAFTWTIGDQIAVHTDAGRFYTSDALTTGGASADFTVSLSGTRDGYAVYPASVAKSWSESTLTLTLPNTYTYAQVSGNNTPLPMIATNTGATLNFYHVGALVRLTVPGIPATADKLIITFDKDVTGDFTLASPTVGVSAITTSSATDKNVVTITLIPGTDYSGAVINIPVPTVTGENKLSITSVVAQYGTTPTTTIETVSADLSNWSATRAHGKKATAAFTPSMYSMVLAPGNLYTESGTLKMADNYYEHIYAFSSNGDYANNNDTYNANNRTHFNYNEVYNLMSGISLTKALAYTNISSYESPAVTKIFNEKSWRIPTRAEWSSMTIGEAPGSARPGAKVRNGESGEYSTGWKFIKVLVKEMGTRGTTYWDDKTETMSALSSSATEPVTGFQAGLLIFPDNVEITGTFEKIGSQNAQNAQFYTTLITKGNLNALIIDGCAFLPATGRWISGGFGYVGLGGYYWSCTELDFSHAYFLNIISGEVKPSSNNKQTLFRSVRLVRDLN